MFLPRALPIASISSIKIIHFFFFFSFANKFLIRDAPTPTNFSIKSEPHADITGIFKLAAIVLTNKVFPVPGGPTNNIPLGKLTDHSKYLFLLMDYLFYLFL